MVTPTLYDQGSIPLIFNDVNVFVKQKEKMNKDVLRFFPEWHDHLSFLTHFRIANRGFLIGINFDLVLGRQSKQILLFHVGKI